MVNHFLLGYFKLKFIFAKNKNHYVLDIRTSILPQ